MSITSMPVAQIPDKILQYALQGQVPEIKPYEALSELNTRVKQKQMAMAMSSNNAIAQSQRMQQQPSIASQVMQANSVLDKGISGLPIPTTRAFNSGGIVAFSDGGLNPYSISQEDRDRANIINVLKQSGDTIGRIAAAGYDITTMPIRALAGIYNTVIRAPRAFGIPVPFIPESFGTESITPAYDKYRQNDMLGNGVYSLPQFPPQKNTTREIIPGTDSNRVYSLPEFPSQVPPQVPPQVPQKSSKNLTITTPARIPSKYEIPILKTPEELSLENMQAEADKYINPRMSEYDKRMEKYRQFANNMESGNTIKTPSQFDRGLNGFLSGAANEVNIARRAGVRPSLGMALAGAANNANELDIAREKLRRETEQKGMELNMLLDSRKQAYESGQYELYNSMAKPIQKRKDDIFAMQNKQSILNATKANEETKYHREDVKNAEELAYKNRALAQEKEIANIRFGDRTKSITQEQLAMLRLNVEKEVDNNIKNDPSYIVMKRTNPVAAEAMRTRMTNEMFTRAIQAATGGTNIPVTPAGRTIDFSTIK